MMDFSDALEALKRGHYVARGSWDGTRLEFHRPTFHLRTGDKAPVEWVVKHEDLVANDWYVVDAPKSMEPVSSVLLAEHRLFGFECGETLK